MVLSSPPRGVSTVFFERFFSDFEREFNVLAESLGFGSVSSHKPDRASTPSKTDFLSRRFEPHQLSADRTSRWRDMVDERKAQAGLEILTAFGLDHMYNDVHTMGKPKS